MSEVEPTAPPTTLFDVWLIDDDDLKQIWVGGSYDNVSAVNIATAAYVRWQQTVGVYDDANALIAYIGKRADVAGAGTPMQ